MQNIVVLVIGLIGNPIYGVNKMLCLKLVFYIQIFRSLPKLYNNNG